MCVGVGVLCMRERDREKVGQPQLSASVNVLTAHLHISMCHELFLSPNLCISLHVCACVCALKGAR